MKKYIILMVIATISLTLYSQKLLKDSLSSREMLLVKSKNQKIAARTLLIGGTALIGIGFIIGDRKEATFEEAGTGFVLGALGALSALGSIPLFLASSRNSRKAAKMVASIKTEYRPALLVSRLPAYPALPFAIRLSRGKKRFSKY